MAQVGQYFIAYMLEGDAKEYVLDLQHDVCERFGTRRLFDTVDPHITLKSPFMSENMHELKMQLFDLASRTEAHDVTLKGFNSFRDSVFFVDVIASDGLRYFNDELLDLVCDVRDVERGVFENDKKYHVTITSKKLKNIFSDIEAYLNTLPVPHFALKMDSFTLLKREGDRWHEVQKYGLK